MTPAPAAPLTIECPAAVADLVDRITILLIKEERISDPDKRANVRHERTILEATLHALPEDRLQALAPFVNDLLSTNACLWDVEDSLRDAERLRRFDGRFILLARAVYRLNDQRAALKRTINLVSGSGLIEEKSYS